MSPFALDRIQHKFVGYDSLLSRHNSALFELQCQHFLGSYSMSKDLALEGPNSSTLAPAISLSRKERNSLRSGESSCAWPIVISVGSGKRVHTCKQSNLGESFWVLSLYPITQKNDHPATWKQH